MILETEIPLPPYDQMIENADGKQFTRLLQLTGKIQILSGGLQVAGGMVVNQDQSVG